jgi:hypothetical protein
MFDLENLEVKRPLVYYTWGDIKQAKELQQLYKSLVAMEITIGKACLCC